MRTMTCITSAFANGLTVARAARCAACLSMFVALDDSAVAHAQIELAVPADKEAVGNPGPLWLKVEDVAGSYTIPYIQSSDRLQVTTTFASEQVVEAEVGLVGSDGARREAKTAKMSGDAVEFTALPPGEYSLDVTGRDAAENVVSRDQHGPVAIGTVIAAIGDSITEGYHSRGFRHDSLDLTPAMFPAEVVSRDRRNYPQFAPTTAHHRPDINCFTSWMPRLNDLLAEKWRQPVFIANEGWGGITTGRYLQMMKTDAGWQKRMRLLRPGVWLIHLGVNDGRANLDADEVARNLAAIVEILVKDHAATPARIFIASPSYDYAPEAADRLAEYRRAIRKLVTEKGLNSGPDFFETYAHDRPRYYGTDPVHPNAEAMELMARLWAESLPAAPPDVPAKPSGKQAAGVNNTLLIFGDSIVAGGYGASVVPLVDEACPGIVFENRGIGGTALTDITYPPATHRAENGVNRYVRDVIERRPRIFVMEYGTNDNYFWNLHHKPDEGLKAFGETYRKVIQDIKRSLPHTRVILQTITPSTYPRHDFEDWTASANTIIQDIAIDEGLVVAAMSRRIGHDYKGFPDGLHPDDEGKRRLAEVLADAILHGRPQARDDWSFSFKGTMPHRMQGYTFTAPALKFDPRGRFGDFVDVAVRGREIEVKTVTPVSILTPPAFQPDATVGVEMTVSDRRETIPARADAEGRLTVMTAPQDCLIRFPSAAVRAP